MLYVSNSFFLISSTTCHSAFYKVLSFPYPTRAVFIFTKIQLTRALPMSGPLKLPLISTLNAQTAPIMCQQQNTLNTDSSLLEIFVQMENSASPDLSIVNFSLQGQCFIFLLETDKVLWTCYWCHSIRRPSVLINFDLVVIWFGWPCCWIQKLMIRSHWGLNGVFVLLIISSRMQGL